MAKLSSLIKGRYGSIAFIPFIVVFAILGFASPVYFDTVSEDTLKDVGDGSKTIDQEILRQLRQNNLGPAEMLLPLTSRPKQKGFENEILKKKKVYFLFIYLDHDGLESIKNGLKVVMKKNTVNMKEKLLMGSQMEKESTVGSMLTNI